MQANRWKKRGLSLVPTRFGLSWQSAHYNVFVAIYHSDGTIAIEHGGVEVGQGINQKVGGLICCPSPVVVRPAVCYFVLLLLYCSQLSVILSFFCIAANCLLFVLLLLYCSQLSGILSFFFCIAASCLLFCCSFFVLQPNCLSFFQSNTQ